MRYFFGEGRGKGGVCGGMGGAGASAEQVLDHQTGLQLSFQ